MRLDPTHFRQAVGNKAPRWPFALDRASPLARELAATWPLFAGPGVGLKDHSGNGAHLVLGAGTLEPSWATRPGLDARALDFDGGDEVHVAAGDVAALDITGDRITLSAWIRPDDTGNANGRRIVSKRTDSGGSDVYALFTITPSGGEIWFRLRIGGADRNLVFATAVTTGIWQHWAGTYDGTTMRLYRNGVEVASQPQTGNIANSARAVHLGHREGEARHFDGAIANAAIWSRCLSAAEIRALYNPSTRWDLWRELAVPRIFPEIAGGVTARTRSASLAAALQRQVSLSAVADAALRAEAVLTALADAALQRVVPRSAGLDAAAKAIKSAQVDLGAALKRSLEATAALDANLTSQGLSQRVAGIDGAIQRLNALSGALEAALRASIQGAAELDAWLALNLSRTAGLNAVARRGYQLSGTALQGILRATPDRAAALDAVIGLVIAAAASRTHKVGARGRNRVAGGQRRSVIPSGSRRH